jgi:hypothetical protein
MSSECLPKEVLGDPFFYDSELSVENEARLEVARIELLAGDRAEAERILSGEADRDPRVHFRIFMRRR